ncbi:glutamate-cysteine ligase-domain-containing protein [Boletus edulis BED1]|uniref:Glutamate--cysteine ligase n=1 Tax=Boletus edulis BED1 TaxID=1328754 RepID=A0AAD4BXZ5_BOLED|nr:glutamate-cysteine ligase-domain-containing protein [Boletus edulis BED1]
MGLLNLGTPLTWDETSKYADHVRGHGITQFLHIWDEAKDRDGDELLWGDELEYMVIAFDDETKNAKLSLRQAEILASLNKSIVDLKADIPDSMTIPTFHPEYARYMLESIPGSPYTGSIQDLLSVASNMHYRRLFVKRHLNPNEVPVTVTSFPRLGVPGTFTEPHFSPDSAKSSHSLFLPEETISQHARYLRKASKLTVNLPLFIDERTPRPFLDPTIPPRRPVHPEDADAMNGAALIDHIYMDALCFGAGCCCLQLTFQSCNIEEARRMYDALVPMGPIMLALTAASPIWRGYLSDVDCRWSVLSSCYDDRTAEERGREPLKENKYVIPKSRFDSVDLYISTDWNNKPAYNDIDVPYNQEIYTRLVNHGIDELLSKHMAHIFIRDPLVVFSETVDGDDETSNDHFENLQSTSWQTVRFKPPPPRSPMGWRVEFRSMEVQLTDFENAAFVVFVVLLSRAVLAFSLNFYIPISKVDENMSRAQKRNAVRQGKFFFRKNVLPPGYMLPTTTPSSSGSSSPRGWQDGIPLKETKLRNGFPRVPPPPMLVDIPVEDEYEEMSMEEIFSGKVGVQSTCTVSRTSQLSQGAIFPGLLGLVEAYLDTLDINSSERLQISKYIDLVRRRANGSLLTTASWMREFVRSHPSYKFDSTVSQEINYDLMVAIDEIERGVLRVPELLPQDYARSRVNGLHESKYEP